MYSPSLNSGSPDRINTHESNPQRPNSNSNSRMSISNVTNSCSCLGSTLIATGAMVAVAGGTVSSMPMLGAGLGLLGVGGVIVAAVQSYRSLPSADVEQENTGAFYINTAFQETPEGPDPAPPPYAPPSYTSIFTSEQPGGPPDTDLPSYDQLDSEPPNPEPNRRRVNTI